MPPTTIPSAAHLAKALGALPQINPRRIVCVPDVTPDRRKGVRVLTEFHGPRVDDVRAVTLAATDALMRAGTPAPVEFVRAGWLPLTRTGRVDVTRAAAKYRKMRTSRDAAELLDGSFALVSEKDKDRFGYFGSLSKVRTPVEISYPGHVELGNWVSLGRYGKIVMLPEASFADTGERYVDQHYPELSGTFDFSRAGENREAKLYLGDGTTLGDRYFIICTSSVEFGKHVMTASNLFVSDCHHTYEHTEIPPALLPVTPGRPVRIEDHVWIGVNCCILEGVTVGRHAVIAANSVVKEDVPPYTLVAGAPARVRKKFHP